MKLTAENVTKVLFDSMFRDEELPPGLRDMSEEDAKAAMPDAVYAQGVMTTFAFHKDRLEAHRADVQSMLDQLPDSFRAVKVGGGGGMSMMNMVADKDGNLWGEQMHADQLNVLGMALGLTHYPLPRDFWQVLPGGMPYVVIGLE